MGGGDRQVTEAAEGIPRSKGNVKLDAEKMSSATEGPLQNAQPPCYSTTRDLLGVPTKIEVYARSGGFEIVCTDEQMTERRLSVTETEVADRQASDPSLRAEGSDLFKLSAQALANCLGVRRKRDDSRKLELFLAEKPPDGNSTRKRKMSIKSNPREPGPGQGVEVQRVLVSSTDQAESKERAAPFPAGGQLPTTADELSHPPATPSGALTSQRLPSESNTFEPDSSKIDEKAITEPLTDQRVGNEQLKGEDSVEEAHNNNASVEGEDDASHSSSDFMNMDSDSDDARPSCALHIQRTWRGNIARAQAKPELERRQTASLRLQANFRGAKGRARARQLSDEASEKMRRELEIKQHDSAAAIQAVARGNRSRAVVEQRRIHRDASATKIQVIQRGRLQRKHFAADKAKKTIAVRKIQATVRGQQAREKMKGAQRLEAQRAKMQRSKVRDRQRAARSGHMKRNKDGVSNKIEASKGRFKDLNEDAFPSSRSRRSSRASPQTQRVSLPSLTNDDDKVERSQILEDRLKEHHRNVDDKKSSRSQHSQEDDMRSTESSSDVIMRLRQELKRERDRRIHAEENVAKLRVMLQEERDSDKAHAPEVRSDVSVTAQREVEGALRKARRAAQDAKRKTELVVLELAEARGRVAALEALEKENKILGKEKQDLERRLDHARRQHYAERRQIREQVDEARSEERRAVDAFECAMNDLSAKADALNRLRGLVDMLFDQLVAAPLPIQGGDDALREKARDAAQSTVLLMDSAPQLPRLPVVRGSNEDNNVEREAAVPIPERARFPIDNVGTERAPRPGGYAAQALRRRNKIMQPVALSRRRAPGHAIPSPKGSKDDSYFNVGASPVSYIGGDDVEKYSTPQS